MPDFAPHTLTGYCDSVTALTYQALASSEFTAGSRFAWKVFDGTSDYWIGTGSGTDWVRLALFGLQALLTSYQVQASSSGTANRAPKNWTMQGSADGGMTWTTLDTQTNQTSWSTSETRTFTIGSPGSTYYTIFRLNISANNGDATYTEVGELYLIGTTQQVGLLDSAPHNMTANNVPSPFVASASSDDSGAFPAFKAFQGLLTDPWVGSNGGTDWLEIDLGTARRIAGYAVASWPTFGTRSPKNWTLQVSGDNATWTTVDTRTNQTGWMTAAGGGALSGEIRPFALTPSLTGGRYIRINVTANNGDATFTSVAQLYLYTLSAFQAAPGVSTAGMLLQVDNGSGTFYTVANTTDFKIPSMAELVDVSEFGDLWRRRVPTLLDMGKITFKIFWVMEDSSHNNSSAVGLRYLMLNLIKRTWRVVYPDGLGSIDSFPAYVTNFEITGATGKVFEGSIELSNSGSPTLV
ncbi:MAG TPA: discoidin domain-containing protein [Candidatus Sulfotelmatobacter sp.]|nr:discoidin domain-containing protein [Candidatus Sulfotelmatobacter sp.]